MKTETRQIAEKVQAITEQSLVVIDNQAQRFLNDGLCKTKLEALEYLLELVQQGRE